MAVLLSIVSHGQMDLLVDLLGDLVRLRPQTEIEVVVTLNLPEEFPFERERFPFPITLVQNKSPRGFGANHNTAFSLGSTDYFCVLNPDLRISTDVFSPLMEILEDPRIGLAAPLIVSPKGEIADSARRLPTPFRLAHRYRKGKREAGPEYSVGGNLFFPDWVAGMFMIFSREVFRRMKGFNQRYHLYFEDVDLCCRLHLAGYRIAVDPRLQVVHNARRESHRNLRYFRWHMTSALRFFASPVFWRCWLRQMKQRKC